MGLRDCLIADVLMQRKLVAGIEISDDVNKTDDTKNAQLINTAGMPED